MQIRFEYSHIFDLEIANLSGQALDEKLANSVEAFIPVLEQKWNETGQPLVSLATKLTGLSFQQKETKCILTVSSFVSMSHPLIVNVKKYIEGSAMDFLIEVIFHEVLHILLTDNWKVWPTELIKKHAGDDDIVAAHLHLMSIERAVHLHLQNQDHLGEVGRWYQRIAGGYDVAWAKISHNDLFQEFLAELKDGSQWGKRN